MRPIDKMSKAEIREAVQDRFKTFLIAGGRYDDSWVGAGADVACTDSIIQLFEYLYTERSDDPSRPVASRQ